MDQAILTAYEKWEPENERAMAFKAQHPTMESAEFWWIDELVDRVTFGRHERDDDYTMTVRWLSGEETTVPSGEKDMKLVRKMFMKRRVRASHKRGRPKKEREKNAFEVLRASGTFQIEPKGPILPEEDNIILVEGAKK